MNFLLFAFNNYYPSGGMNDLQAGFYSLEEFNQKSIDSDYDMYQILDMNDGTIRVLQLRDDIQKIDAKNDLGFYEEEELRTKMIRDFVKDFVEGK